MLTDFHGRANQSFALWEQRISSKAWALSVILLFQFQMNTCKKEWVLICKFKMNFKKSFCWCLNLSTCTYKDNIFPPTPGLKTGMDFRGQVWELVWKMIIVWSEMGSGFGELGGTPAPWIPKNTPPVACEQAHLCECKENYFGSRANIKQGKVRLYAGYWLLNYAPFKVSRYYPTGAKQT